MIHITRWLLLFLQICEVGPWFWIYWNVNEPAAVTGYPTSPHTSAPSTFLHPFIITDPALNPEIKSVRRSSLADDTGATHQYLGRLWRQNSVRIPCNSLWNWGSEHTIEGKTFKTIQYAYQTEPHAPFRLTSRRPTELSLLNPGKKTALHFCISVACKICSLPPTTRTCALTKSLESEMSCKHISFSWALTM